MRLTARPATDEDADLLIEFYRMLEAEQSGLKAMWPLADGMPEPAEAAMKDALGDARTATYIGAIDDYPLGFVQARIEGLLPQADGEEVGALRLIFVEPEARGVGLGETMINALLDDLRSRGLRRFDAHVLPGHREAKNFYERAGFAARSIVMYREDE